MSKLTYHLLPVVNVSENKKSPCSFCAMCIQMFISRYLQGVPRFLGQTFSMYEVGITGGTEIIDELYESAGI